MITGSVHFLISEMNPQKIKNPTSINRCGVVYNAYTKYIQRQFFNALNCTTQHTGIITFRVTLIESDTLTLSIFQIITSN